MRIDHFENMHPVRPQHGRKKKMLNVLDLPPRILIWLYIECPWYWQIKNARKVEIFSNISFERAILYLVTGNA